MMRMTFKHTRVQILAGTKTVTRRHGWVHLEPGTLLLAVAAARRPNAEVLRVIEVVSVRSERLEDVTPEDVVAEGWPAGTPVEDFVTEFLRAIGGERGDKVRRVEFRFVPGCTCPALFPDQRTCPACARWPRLSPKERAMVRGRAA